MQNTFTDNRDRWIQMSEVDYLGQFVKVWLAFNAWYRSAYTETRDREIIEEIKWNPNPVLSKFRPLLENTSEEAEQFRTDIGLLHNRLENYELHHGKGNDKERIRFSELVVRAEPPVLKHESYYHYECTVERAQNGSITLSVKNAQRAKIVDIQQSRYDRAFVKNHPDFTANLTSNIQDRFLRLYDLVNPLLPRNLLEGEEAPIVCGTCKFCCGAEFLFAGVVEVIYQMRCSLFHGELVPTREASMCYEPAYRIVRKFLDAIT